MPDESKEIQEFATEWNRSEIAKFEPMPIECYARNMPRVTEVPCSPQ